MKKAVVFLLVVMVCFGFYGCTLWQDTGDVDSNINMTPRQIVLDGETNTIDLVNQVKSAVVGISSTLSNGYSVGSGVAVADGGYILTNQHVISGAKSIRVYFANKTDAKASLIWQDSVMDLAVIKSEVNMPYLECGDDNEVFVGEDIIAIGTPLTLEFKHTVTKGIISALNRTLQIQGATGTISYMQNLIQHDASINPGNSGGPIINARGQIVGINTLKASEAEGLGFAIPIKMGKAAMKQISANGKLESGYMGVFGVDADIAKFKGEKVHVENGVFVSHLDPNASVSLCGLKKGDIIVEIQGNKILNTLDLRTAMYEYHAGDELEIKVIREKQFLTFRCKLEKR